MSFPDIDFNCIRPVNGARSDGFEELCCQLASLEPAPPGSRFFRKGRGGDAGVECFLRLDNGDETGWQAKHLFAWDAGCASQLDKSIGTALEKHPRLTEYVVCLPFDLPDSRSGGAETALQKWERWHTKWTQRAAKQERDLRITLWGKSELFARLVSDDPARAGRVLYWFGVEMLGPAWFDAQFEKARVSLGTRYIPETNVDLPIRRDFLTLTRHPLLQKEIDDWCSRLAEKGGRAASAVHATRADDYHRRSVTLDGRALELTATEFDLLRALSLDAGRTVTYETLLRRVWAGRKGARPKTVRTYVQRLREKLRDDANRPVYIVTDPRVGYRMNLGSLGSPFS